MLQKIYAVQCFMNKKTKTEFRLIYKNIRNSISAEIRTEKSKIITKKVLTILNEQKYKTCFVYNSFSSEVQTGELIKCLLEMGKKVLIPKCNIADYTMKAVIYNPTDSFVENEYGIKENCADDDFSEIIDSMIVPGIAFSRIGSRIGFGKGYYDKFINNLKTKPLIIGLCFDEQIIDAEMNFEEHDAKMDIVVTDEEIIKINCE